MASRRWPGSRGLGSLRARLRPLGIVLAVVVVGLVLVGQGIFLARAIGGGVWNTSASSGVIPTRGSLSHRLEAVLTGALGSSDRGVRRFMIVHLSRSPGRKLSAVTVRWAINDDLSAGTVGNGAQADAYTMLRDIFISGLPVGSVRLDGTYPMPDGRGHMHETVVMRLAMSTAVAATIGNIGWDNLDPQTAWPLIDRLYVNPQVQPLPQE
jgi:hypothetical protein